MTSAELECFDRLLAMAPAGMRIEFGVFRGVTLKRIAAHAGVTIGVDSFAGMAAPGERDVKNGWCPYPEGRLAAPQVEAKRRAPTAILVSGYVPEVLAGLPDGPFAFAHVDMDQYAPTFAAMHWLWPRMMPGGIICADDWFAERDWLSGGALNDFAAVHPMAGTVERKAWWIC
jgi:O-methyltransferase